MNTALKTVFGFGLILAFLIPEVLLARGFGHSFGHSFGVHSRGPDVAVRGYTRKDGTYVSGYMRSAPNDTIKDNFSYHTNINPYTGKKGTVYGDDRYHGSRVSKSGGGSAFHNYDERYEFQDIGSPGNYARSYYDAGSSYDGEDGSSGSNTWFKVALAGIFLLIIFKLFGPIFIIGFLVVLGLLIFLGYFLSNLITLIGSSQVFILAITLAFLFIVVIFAIRWIFYKINRFRVSINKYIQGF
jgi:hypothetical protein